MSGKLLRQKRRKSSTSISYVAPSGGRTAICLTPSPAQVWNCLSPSTSPFKDKGPTLSDMFEAKLRREENREKDNADAHDALTIGVRGRPRVTGLANATSNMSAIENQNVLHEVVLMETTQQGDRQQQSRRSSLSSHLSPTGGDHEVSKTDPKPSASELCMLKNQVMDLSTRLSEKDLKFHQLTQRLNDFENEAQRQRRLNQSLTNELREVKKNMVSKTQEFEEEKSKMEAVRESDLEDYMKQAVQMKKKMNLLTGRLRIKEELIIPGLLEQLKEKELLLDRAENNLTEAIENWKKCRADLEILIEERDALATELQKNISDTGNSANEMHEVLRLRDKMAKDFVKYKMSTEKRIEHLEEDRRRKDNLIEKLLRRIESLKAPMLSISLKDDLERHRKKSWDQLCFAASWKTKMLLTGGVVALAGITATVAARIYWK